MSKKSAKASIGIFKIFQLLLISLLPVLLVIGTISAAIEKKRNEINPKDFSTSITNKYFSLPVGKTFVYEKRSDEGLERNEITATGETKVVMGVTTLVLFDKAYLNGKLKEDTRDYIAQHKNGDVWYFGEDVDNYDKFGKFANHGGAWLSGINNAKPGILIKQNPATGETYQQEFYKREAEDMVTVLSTEETVETSLGTYTDCLKTYDWTPLDPSSREHKYHCPGVATLVAEVDLINGERAELIEIK